ncbi:MAG TPA: glycosyltransferase, partial [Bacteroidota bacterium]
MSFLELDLSVVFVLVVILIWFWIAYQFALTIFGYINFVRSIKERRSVDANPVELPTCSILIPAHNEEKVIAATIESMLKLDYPKDRFKVVVVNDGSSDSTRSIVSRYVKADSRVVLYNVPAGEGGKG